MWKNDSILMNNLSCLLNSIPFDGHSVIQGLTLIMSFTAWTMGRGVQSFRLSVPVSVQPELCIYSSVVQIKETNCFVNACRGCRYLCPGKVPCHYSRWYYQLQQGTCYSHYVAVCPATDGVVPCPH